MRSLLPGGGDCESLVGGLRSDGSFLPIGLYRATPLRRGVAREWFVFTNPPAGTVLDGEDRVFVISTMLHASPKGKRRKMLIS